MKQRHPKILLSLLLTGLLGLGFASIDEGHASAPDATTLEQPSGAAGPPSTPQLQRANLDRVQLEEQLIRSDASAVMLGAWMEQRQTPEAKR